MAQSKFGKVNWRDGLHGFVVAFLTAFLTGLLESLQTGHLPSVASAKVHLSMGLVAGLSYIIKQLLQNESGVLLKKTTEVGENPQKPPKTDPPTEP